MRNPAAIGRTDANHAEIVDAYEALYCRVQDAHKIGGGFPDLICRITTRRGFVIALVEVKTTDGRLSPSQLRFIGEWGSCVTVVQTREDVFAHVERVRNGQ
jgi:VRR-NUC domain